MKFGIYRTSESLDYSDRPQPVPEATPVDIKIVGQFREDKIVRRWEIEFNTLDELLAFIKKYNEQAETGTWSGNYMHIIIDAIGIEAALPWEFEIEIQDGYRE